MSSCRSFSLWKSLGVPVAWLHHLSDSSFSHDNVEFDEIAPNVIKAKATDVLNDYLSFVVENVPVEDVKSAYDFLTIVPGQLKTICDTTHPILPIWEREKRNHCFAVRPIYMSKNDYIYSPIIMEEVRKRWIEGFLQFYPPFEIGLERTCIPLMLSIAGASHFSRRSCLICASVSVAIASLALLSSAVFISLISFFSAEIC